MGPQRTPTGLSAVPPPAEPNGFGRKCEFFFLIFEDFKTNYITNAVRIIEKADTF
jgi:hypothetical protein